MDLLCGKEVLEHQQAFFLRWADHVLVTTPQSSVGAQAGDAGAHSRFHQRSLIHMRLLKDAKLPAKPGALFFCRERSVWVQGQRITAGRL